MKNYKISFTQIIKNWVEAPFDELVDHIVNVHHGYLYENLPKNK